MRERTERRVRHEGNVLLLDPVKGFSLTFRERNAIPDESEPLKYKGRFVHLCTQSGDALVAVNPPEKAVSTPERVYRARFWAEVRLIFGMKATWREKIDRALWLGALGILAFLTFMLVASVLG